MEKIILISVLVSLFLLPIVYSDPVEIIIDYPEEGFGNPTTTTTSPSSSPGGGPAPSEDEIPGTTTTTVYGTTTTLQTNLSGSEIEEQTGTSKKPQTEVETSKEYAIIKWVLGAVALTVIVIIAVVSIAFKKKDQDEIS